MPDMEFTRLNCMLILVGDKTRTTRLMRSDYWFCLHKGSTIRAYAGGRPCTKRVYVAELVVDKVWRGTGKEFQQYAQRAPHCQREGYPILSIDEWQQRFEKLVGVQGVFEGEAYRLMVVDFTLTEGVTYSRQVGALVEGKKRDDNR